MVTTASFLSKVFWVSGFWTFIFVHFLKSEKTFPTKNWRENIINCKSNLKKPNLNYILKNDLKPPKPRHNEPPN